MLEVREGSGRFRKQSNSNTSLLSERESLAHLQSKAVNCCGNSSNQDLLDNNVEQPGGLLLPGEGGLGELQNQHRARGRHQMVLRTAETDGIPW